MDVSVILPAYDEGENLVPVVSELVAVLDGLDRKFEVIVVDDGSRDATPDAIAELRSRCDQVRSVRLRRNTGKAAALAIGLGRATGAVVVLMDADGQDEPAAIPAMLRSLDDGLDLVTGRRVDRQHGLVKRRTSRVYNFATSKVTGVKGQDFNSGLKAMRHEVAGSLNLYGELHRYIPVLAAWTGFRVGEIDVPHRARLHGETKFGRARFWRGFLDLVTVRFLATYNARPLHLFGGVGATVGMIGSGLLVWMLVERLLGRGIGGRPAFITGVLLVIVAVQLVSLGLIAELVVHYAARRESAPPIEEDP